jgi:hypothetical protein
MIHVFKENDFGMLAAEQLKAIVMQETPPSEADALREFVAAYVFQTGRAAIRFGERRY